jgi:hypothetical protein
VSADTMWTRIGHDILDSQRVAAAQTNGVADEIGTREAPGTTACLKDQCPRTRVCTRRRNNPKINNPLLEKRCLARALLTCQSWYELRCH